MPVQPGANTRPPAPDDHRGCPDAVGEPGERHGNIAVQYPKRPLRPRRTENRLESLEKLLGRVRSLLVGHGVQGYGGLGGGWRPLRQVAGGVDERTYEVQVQSGREAGSHPDGVVRKVPADAEHERSGRPLISGHGLTPFRSVCPWAQPQSFP